MGDDSCSYSYTCRRQKGREESYHSIFLFSSHYITSHSVLQELLEIFVMPFFKRRKNKLEISNSTASASTPYTTTSIEGASASSMTTTATPSKPSKSILKPSKSGFPTQENADNHSKPAFHCQLAHGSPTGSISGFNNIKDLYEKIATHFNIPVSTVSHQFSHHDFYVFICFNRFSSVH